MSFWIAAVVISALVFAALAYAVLRARDRAAPAGAEDVQVYRDQLREVERDLKRGVIDEAEAQRVRLEVSRRLLEADRAAQGAKDAPAEVGLPRWPVIALALAASGGALGVYWTLGAPDYPDLPIKARLAAAEEARSNRPSQTEAEAQTPSQSREAQADPKLLDLMKKLRAALKSRPNELKGHELLARNEAALGNFKAAYKAQERVVAIKGDQATAEDYAALGELMILAAGGYVSPEAESALSNALQRDPKNGSARFYSGLMFAQTGRPDVAFELWRQLLEEGPADAPWIAPIRQQIMLVAQAAGQRYTLPPEAPAKGAAPLAGPSASDVAAAQQMSAQDRQQMIRGMVGRLANRLDTEGGTPEEWARLINALGVLGEIDKAKAAWVKAQAAFADAPQDLATVRAAAQKAGVAN